MCTYKSNKFNITAGLELIKKEVVCLNVDSLFKGSQRILINENLKMVTNLNKITNKKNTEVQTEMKIEKV